MQFTGSPGQAGEEVTSADPKAPPEAPSWSRVLATTLSLWASRRLARPRRPRRVLLLVICVLVVGAATLGVVRLTGTSSRGARVSSPSRPYQVRPGGSAGSAGSAAAAASVRSRAAAWIAGQLSTDDTIGCDPLMCAALAAHGVATSRLLPLGPAASSAPGADVIAAPPLPRTAFSRAAPALLASFGSGSSLIEVRVTSAGGAASYQAALQADVAARRSAGAQLLHSRRIEVDAQGAGQGAGQLQAARIRAGQVDSRLLVMLAVLASQRSWRVIAFGDASPGVPLAEAPFRQVIITGASGRDEAAGLAVALALLRAQRAPYQAAQITTVQLADGQTGLRIDFAAPSPLGLLTGGAPR
jgi:hypothetical protein